MRVVQKTSPGSGAMVSFPRRIPMEEALKAVSGNVAVVLEALSVLTIAIGACEAPLRLVPVLWRLGASHGARRSAWLSLARWLLLGRNSCWPPTSYGP